MISLPIAATATNPFHTMSPSYAHVTTTDVLDALTSDGWNLNEASQARSRIPGKSAHTKHLLRLSHPEIARIDGVIPQAVVLNSSDGSSALRIMLGMFRMACANGIITGNTMAEFRLHHRGADLSERVVAHASTLRSQTAAMADVVERWQNTPLNNADLEDFGQAAINIRSPKAISVTGVWNPDTAERVEHVAGRQFLAARRREDANQNLWTVFNRAQESLINGQYRLIKPTEDGGWKASNARRVTGLDRSVKINQAIWDLASEMDVALN